MSHQKKVEFHPALAAFLRARHPTKTAESAAAETGIAAETIRCWLKGAAKPGCAHLLALIGSYGPEFLMAVYPAAPRWLEAAHRAERQRALEDEIAAVEGRLADLTRPTNETGMAAINPRLAAPGADRERVPDAVGRAGADRLERARGEARRAAGAKG